MTRRFHTPTVKPGLNPLDARQGKHARDVLRLDEGAEVELFDDTGNVASGVLAYEGNKASVLVRNVDSDLQQPAVKITVAAAIPKGDRADWMVEKLSELGVSVFIPLAAERSVVIPDGTHKHERWQRIATESAKQCRRHGVMRIENVAKLDAGGSRRRLFALRRKSNRNHCRIFSKKADLAVTLLIGPEGGWTAGELEFLKAKKVKFARLTGTILRTETAAIAAAAAAAMLIPDVIAF